MLVKSIEAEGYTATTYNLTVANAHTFFVGEERIWVHNQNAPCGTLVSPEKHYKLSDSELAKKVPNEASDLSGIRVDPENQK